MAQEIGSCLVPPGLGPSTKQCLSFPVYNMITLVYYEVLLEKTIAQE